MSRPYEKKAYMAILHFDTLLTDDEIEALKKMPEEKIIEFILSNAVPVTMYGGVDFENEVLKF